MKAINLRHESGRGVIQWVTSDTVPHTDRRRIVLLIHGFATHAQSAKSTYERFARRVEFLSGGRLPAGTDFWAVYWPGDDWNPVISRLTYGSRVPEADNAGEKLGEVLELLSHKDVVIVAHSLGCRVALNGIVKFDTKHQARQISVSRVVLMAAAVPRFDVEGSTGRFRREVLAPGIVQHVMYSKRDLVLRGLFPIGQRVARSGWSNAVGLTGKPKGRWDRAERYSFGHGGYWKSEFPARSIARLLGSNTPHEPTGRSMEEWASTPSRSIASWTPRWRSV